MSWIVPAALGAFHGLNPAMGWLLAVALGLQERRSLAVVRALPPIALGHAASVAVILASAAGASLVVPPAALRAAGAVLLLGYAAWLLLRRVHPRWVGMRLGARDLALWSFVMSSAHGAGLMLLPVLVGASAVSAAGDASGHATHAVAHASAGAGIVAIHTVAMFGAMAAAALVAFRFLGVDFLRRTWLNTDVLWALALAASGIALLWVR